jgi:hypothetical protein
MYLVESALNTRVGITALLCVLRVSVVHIFVRKNNRRGAEHTAQQSRNQNRFLNTPKG